MKLVVAAILTWLIAFPASAETIFLRPLSLHPGETVVIRFKNGIAFVERRGSAGPISDFDAYGAWRSAIEQVPPGVKVMPPLFVMQGEGAPPAPPLIPDQVQLTFRAVPGPQTDFPPGSVLIIRNGYASKLSYQAAIDAKGKLAQTDVCEVAPRHPNFEYWPYPVAEIQISDLKLEQPDGQITCI